MKYYFFTDFEKEWLSKPAKKAAIQLVQTWLASYLKWLSITLQMVSEWSSWPAITLHVMYKGMTTFINKILAFIHLDQLIFSKILRFQNWQFTSRKGKCKNLQCGLFRVCIKNSTLEIMCTHCVCGLIRRSTTISLKVV